MARRILLADDSVTAQNMGRRILTDAGYEVVTVNNGSAALKKIAENKPDLIVLDVYMPGYGGLEVCQRVKENPETKLIPVLLTVGKLEPFKAEEARRVGADSFIIKPFEATELLTVLTKLEDKIVAQPQPQKSGRFAKALAAVEQSDKGERFGDRETGWKNRLTIPVPPAKPLAAEEAPEIPAAAAGPEMGASASRDREPIEAVKPVESHRFERPIPAGLPADITPEEIAAITAAALVFGGKTEQPSATVETTIIENTIVANLPVENTIPETVANHETVSSEPASAQSIEAGASAAVQATAPELSQPEIIPADASHEVPTFEVRSHEVQSHEVQSHEVQSHDAQVSAPVEAVSEPVASGEAANVQDHQVQEIQGADNRSTDVHSHDGQAPAAQVADAPARTELPAVAASAEIVSEVQVSHPTSAVAGDAEVLAAIASLAPTNGPIDSVYSVTGSNGTAIASAAASGPRWIAQPVEVGSDEAKLALDQEMDQFLAARASAEAASLSAAAADASAGAVAVAEPEQPVVTEAIATEFAVVPESNSPAIAAETGVSEFVVNASGVDEPVVGESGTIEAAVNESTAVEGTATHDQQPIAAEVSAYAAAASAGAGLQGSAVSGSVLPHVSSEQVSPVEAVSATSAVPENSAVAQVESTPQREAELAAAWQNWKQIRESFGRSKSPAAPAEVPAELKPEPAQDAAAVSTEAVAEPATEVEEETDAPEESTAIASIVDNMLAELRPKLVAEIAKKMNSDKDKKDKEKKKKK